jgi:hypothetical protein
MKMPESQSSIPSGHVLDSRGTKSEGEETASSRESAGLQVDQDHVQVLADQDSIQ